MRASTTKQGANGLGVEAQCEALRRYLLSHHGEQIAEFGPQITAAMAPTKELDVRQRIVELRLKSVSAADLGLTKAEPNLKNLNSKHESANTGDTNRRREFVDQLKGVETQINA